LEAEQSRRVDEPYAGGESYRDVVNRMRGFLDDLQPGYDGGRIVVIGHSATRWALDHLLCGRPLEDVVGPFDWQEGWEYVFERRLPSG